MGSVYPSIFQTLNFSARRADVYSSPRFCTQTVLEGGWEDFISQWFSAAGAVGAG